MDVASDFAENVLREAQFFSGKFASAFAQAHRSRINVLFCALQRIEMPGARRHAALADHFVPDALLQMLAQGGNASARFRGDRQD